MSRRSLSVSITTGMLAATAFGVIWWLGYENRSAGVELSSVIQTLNDKEATANDQRVLVDLLESTKEERSSLSSRIIVGDAGAIQFLSRIDSLAARNNIELETQTLTVVPNARPPYSGLSVNYSFTGSEQSVRTFVRALETVPYSSSLDSLSVSKTRDGRTGLVVVEGTATLVIAMLEI